LNDVLGLTRCNRQNSFITLNTSISRMNAAGKAKFPRELPQNGSKPIFIQSFSLYHMHSKGVIATDQLIGARGKRKSYLDLGVPNF
jgi:hypothetical protein